MRAPAGARIRRFDVVCERARTPHRQVVRCAMAASAQCSALTRSRFGRIAHSTYLTPFGSSAYLPAFQGTALPPPPTPPTSVLDVCPRRLVPSTSGTPSASNVPATSNIRPDFPPCAVAPAGGVCTPHAPLVCRPPRMPPPPNRNPTVTPAPNYGHATRCPSFDRTLPTSPSCPPESPAHRRSPAPAHPGPAPTRLRRSSPASPAAREPDHALPPRPGTESVSALRAHGPPLGPNAECRATPRLASSPYTSRSSAPPAIAPAALVGRCLRAAGVSDLKGVQNSPGLASDCARHAPPSDRGRLAPNLPKPAPPIPPAPDSAFPREPPHAWPHPHVSSDPAVSDPRASFHGSPAHAATRERAHRVPRPNSRVELATESHRTPRPPARLQRLGSAPRASIHGSVRSPAPDFARVRSHLLRATSLAPRPRRGSRASPALPACLRRRPTRLLSRQRPSAVPRPPLRASARISREPDSPRRSHRGQDEGAVRRAPRQVDHRPEFAGRGLQGGRGRSSVGERRRRASAKSGGFGMRLAESR
ncbi:hypothetical protein B0H10DRAFT_2436238 [Mycena sp. CBHHK59/15]|nr:hypothetical protein B0H10DRAFT_2436238 [Mycena sp. CBHHK59/15]